MFATCPPKRRHPYRPLAGAAAAAAAALVSTSCLVVSLQPFYERGAIEFDEHLLGTWLNPEDNVTVTFEHGPWTSYRVIYRDGDRALVFSAYRTTIGSAAFLDLSAEAGVETSPVSVPAHSAFRIEAAEKTLKVSALNYDWFVDASERGRLGPLAYGLDAKRNVVLTSPTRTIRDWLAAHLKQTEVFAEPVVLTRKE